MGKPIHIRLLFMLLIQVVMARCVMASKNQQITWTDDLSVGVPHLDDQHKELIRLINGFGRDELSQDELAENLEGLIAYAAYHFNDEEDFILNNAADLLSHQADSHANFIEKSYGFASRFSDGEGEGLRQDVYTFLCQWLIGHIKEEDQQYNRS